MILQINTQAGMYVLGAVTIAVYMFPSLADINQYVKYWWKFFLSDFFAWIYYWHEVT